MGTKHPPHRVRSFASRRGPLWGRGEGVPGGGVPCAAARGVWGQELVLPRLPILGAGSWGLPPTCCGPGCAGMGAWHCPFGVHALQGAARRGSGRRLSRGGRPLIVVRGVWCQALSLSRPPALEAGSEAPLPVFLGRRQCWRGGPAPATQRAWVARCGGGGRASPNGAAPRCCEGRLGLGARPLLPTFSGRGCAGLGAGTGYLACMPCGGLRAAGVARGYPGGGGLPLTTVTAVWCQALSPSRPPVPEAGGQALLPVFPGRGWCGRGDPALAPQHALLRAGVARCGVGGKASPGGLPCAVVRGV